MESEPGDYRVCMEREEGPEKGCGREGSKTHRWVGFVSGCVTEGVDLTTCGSSHHTVGTWGGSAGRSAKPSTE